MSQLDGDQDDNGFVNPVTVTWTDEAEKIWAPWYDKHAERQTRADPLLRPAYAKIEAYGARLALIFHTVLAVQDQAGDQIDAETVRNAITVADWFVHETQRVYATIRAKDEDAELLVLAEAVRRRGGEVTVRDLVRSGPRSVQGDPTATEARLNQLVQKGWGKWHPKRPGPQGGRPTRIFKLQSEKTKPREKPRTRRIRLQSSERAQTTSAADNGEIEEIIL